MSQSTINDSNNCLNTTNSHNTTTTNNNNVWNNCTVADDLSPLLAWLSPLDPGLRHCDIQERRVKDVREWLMRTEEFRRWCGLGGEGQGDKAVLFCYGNPGVGKTFISSLVVDRLCDQMRGQHTAVTCFYFDFAARKEQTATSMLGSVLKQVINGMERIPEVISRALQEQKKGLCGRNPHMPDIVKMLQLITSSQPTFMVIDALDEYTAVQRFKLFDSLKEIIEKSPGARIFVTGRPHIRAEIETRLAGRVRGISLSPARDDIIRFLRVRLSEDETPDAMDETLEADILKKIPGSISEMFLLVSLNIEAILQEPTIYRRREKLNRMTPGLGLGDVYSATIERIKAQGGEKSRLGIGALMWISYAERPLMADQLCHALAIEMGSTDFNAANIPSMTTLVSCCQGLITVDKEASTVRLIHFTLKEYLSAHPHIFTRPHSAMAEICLTYLNSQHIRALPIDPRDYSFSLEDPNPFLEYCSLYWGVHAKQDLSNYARSLALQLLQEYGGHVSIRFLVQHIGSLDLHSSSVCDNLSGVHCASFFGIVEVVAALIEMKGYGTNRGYHLGNSPLALAARNGHVEVVKILLGWEGVDPDEPNDHGQTPLSYAAGYGNGRVVEILLGRAEVNPERVDSLGRTPLSYAVGYGHQGVVMILLLGRAGVSPDRVDGSGRTLLSHAAGGGQETVVKIILEWEGVDPDKPDNTGRTPLSFAAEKGDEEVVKLLLGLEEVNSDKPDNNGRTPLSHAAEEGHYGCVKILLGRKEVEPEKPDKDGRTPLSFAAGRDKEVVKLLLGLEEVNTDKPDKNGRTPLSYAALEGNDGCVKILLGRKEVEPDKPDNDGRTPLSYAAGEGNDGCVKILLGRKEIDPEKPDNHGQTPLSHAAQCWYGSRALEVLVKLLLGREEVNSDEPDNNGRTPLSHAAHAGIKGVAKVLLEQEDVNPEEPDDDGRTPLSYAAGCWRGNIAAEGVVKILLGREEVNSDKPDNKGRTPLSYGAESGYEAVVGMLLGREEVNPEKHDNNGRTPLSHAAGNSNHYILSDTLEGVVEILLGREEVNPDRPDNHGQTPLAYASYAGREGVLKILLGREEVNPDKPDNNGRTPLSHTARKRSPGMFLDTHEGVAKILLGREEVNPDKLDKLGRTPLSYAAEHGFEGMVGVLLGREEVNPDKSDNLGRRPLMLASNGGHEALIKLLHSRKEVVLERSNPQQSQPRRSYCYFL